VCAGFLPQFEAHNEAGYGIISAVSLHRMKWPGEPLVRRSMPVRLERAGILFLPKADSTASEMG
jgi:hypothetical protein